MEDFDLKKYLDIVVRRKWWIIIPFLLSILGGLTFALVVPRIYKAETLILVQPQKVPEDYVRTIDSAGVEARLRTITQQVTSRTNLEKIIRGHELFSKRGSKLLLEEQVERLRKRINIVVSHQTRRRDSTADAFTIEFFYDDAKKAMEVTNALASNFISENLRIREAQAQGTSNFLSDELENVKKRLMEKETELKEYRERYMGGLPEQLDTNLSILERLQDQMTQLHDNLSNAENRKIAIQTQIADQERSRALVTVPSASGLPVSVDITSLRNELTALQAKYTQNHPDVIRLSKRIERLEAESSESETSSAENGSSTSAGTHPIGSQLQEIEQQIERLRNEITKTQSKINWYESKVEETPKREQELLSLNRDYENLKELYDSLLERKLESEIAVSLEKKQQGEQFSVIDPANLPTRPVEPDILKIILITLVLGLGLGGGLAFLLEIMDTSYKSPEEVEKDLQLPVMVSLPFRYNERELKSMKMKRILVVVSVFAGFVLSAAGIVFGIKGVDVTVGFFRQILLNI